MGSSVNPAKSDYPYPSRRAFLAAGAGLLAAGGLPAFASGTGAAAAYSPLAAYAWAGALTLWPRAQAGTLRAVYMTFGEAECGGLDAVRTVAAGLVGVSPLLDLNSVQHVSAAGSGGVLPRFWTCTFTAASGAQAVITIRKGAGHPPVLRGEQADLEVRSDGLILTLSSGQTQRFDAAPGAYIPPDASSLAQAHGLVLHAWAAWRNVRA